MDRAVAPLVEFAYLLWVVRLEGVGGYVFVVAWIRF